MYRDLSKGNHVEVEQILGDLLEQGREFGVVTPLIQASYANLRVYEARLFGEMRSFRISNSREMTSFLSEDDRRINIHRTTHWLPRCHDADGPNNQQSTGQGQWIEGLDAIERRCNDSNQ
jgi:hypothetical protein